MQIVFIVLIVFVIFIVIVPSLCNLEQSCFCYHDCSKVASSKISSKSIKIKSSCPVHWALSVASDTVSSVRIHESSSEMSFLGVRHGSTRGVVAWECILKSFRNVPGVS